MYNKGCTVIEKDTVIVVEITYFLVSRLLANNDCVLIINESSIKKFLSNGMRTCDKFEIGARKKSMIIFTKTGLRQR